MFTTRSLRAVCFRNRQCLRALHRRTLRDAALRRQRENSPEGPPAETFAPNYPGAQQGTQQAGGGSPCPEDVHLHSFEVWAPLCEIGNIKLLPLKTPTAEETGTSFEAENRKGAPAPAVSEAVASLGSSPRIGEASTQYKDLCLIAGEVGVSVGRVYTSLTAFTDADSAGTAQLTATRLLLRKAGKWKALLDSHGSCRYRLRNTGAFCTSSCFWRR